jgi:hypothetical protein
MTGAAGRTGQQNVMNRIALVSLFSLAGCLDGAIEPPTKPDIDDRPGAQQPTEPVPPSVIEPTPIVTDTCDDNPYTGATWDSLTTQHFTLQYIPNTAAEFDRLVIARRLEAAYTDIRGKLGITDEPVFTVNLSPSRTAASANGRAFGHAWPSSGRYDVVYTGAYDSFEVVRYGTMLTWMLDYHVDATNKSRLSLLSTGIAEYLDQSGRDLHREYIERLDAGIESRVHLADFDDDDVWGSNPGRAGSLVKFLVDRYGMATFANIYRASTVAWNGSCYANATYGCVATPAQIAAMLDGILTAKTGETWATVQPLWQATLETAMARIEPGMPAEPTAQIENVVRLMDKAIATKDAAMYRSTLEGFYCDYGGEQLRTDIADRAVHAFGSTTTTILGLYYTGIKNFATAQALVMRTDDSGTPTFSTLYFEHVPDGWRVSWGPDWF